MYGDLYGFVRKCSRVQRVRLENNVYKQREIMNIYIFLHTYTCVCLSMPMEFAAQRGVGSRMYSLGSRV